MLKKDYHFERHKKTSAENPNTPVRHLVKLACSDDYDILRGVTSNLSTPSSILDKLTCHGYLHVFIAQNPNTLPKTLKKMMFNSDGNVQCAISENPKTPKMVLIYYTLTNSSWTTLSNVATNPNTPEWCLVRLSSHSEVKVRDSVGSNEKTPLKYLIRLYKEDHTGWVKKAVEKNPSMPKNVLNEIKAEIRNKKTYKRLQILF